MTGAARVGVPGLPDPVPSDGDPMGVTADVRHRSRRNRGEAAQCEGCNEDPAQHPGAG